MRSIRAKITILNVIAISIALIVAAVIASVSIATFAHSSTEQTVELLCQTGKNNLNYYFKSVEQSTNTVSTLIENDLEETIKDDDYANSFREHIEYADDVFLEASENTNGVFSYYYRVDLSITDETGGRETGEKGFWYIANEKDGKSVFESHEVSALDESACPWFHKPKAEGKALWLLPYSTDNLDNVYVISYNVPVYRRIGENERRFVGVVGIEISYHTLGDQIKNIKVLQNGYAFIVDKETGLIIYHPFIDLYGKTEEERPITPPEFVKGLQRGDQHIVYKYEGVEKHCHILELSNGMCVVVTVPTSDISNVWFSVVIKIVIAALVLIAIFITVTVLFARRITKPLKDLTVAAEEIDKGNYNVKLDYKGRDEIGILTSTVDRLIQNLGGYIADLNSLAYADALTDVRNKSAFDIVVREVQKRIDEKEEGLQFAIAIFDCDDLKTINDEFGHDKGNVYLRNASHLMCRVFQKSVIYRVGGDEFAIILTDDDFKRRETLKNQFLKKSAEICSFAKEAWEEIRVSVGIATYDPSIDKTVQDVIIHADHLMYANKRDRKKGK